MSIETVRKRMDQVYGGKAEADSSPSPQPSPDPWGRVLACIMSFLAVLISTVLAPYMSPETPATTPSPKPSQPTEWAHTYVKQNGKVVEVPLVLALAGSSPGRYVITRVPKTGDEELTTVVIGGGPSPLDPTPVAPAPPKPSPPPGPGPAKVTAVTYVYEKGETPVPSSVLSALNRLNREKQVVATLFEDDTTNGNSKVPKQYTVPWQAAKSAGLPALVVTGGDVVLKVVKDPRTVEQIMESVE